MTAQANLSAFGGWSYSFDNDNRLKSASTGLLGIPNIAFSYDAEGRIRQTVDTAGLFNSTTINYLDDADRLVAEYDSTGNTVLRRYVFGPGVDNPIVWYEGATTGAKNWLYLDHLGSVIATGNVSGAKTATYTYGPFGEQSSITGVRFRYTGQLYFSTPNLYSYKARFYSASLGRFLQTDPAGNRDDQNLYAYVGNDPLNKTDPTGLASFFTGESYNVSAQGDRPCQGPLCSQGGSYGSSGAYYISGGYRCWNCGLFLTGLQDAPYSVQQDTMKNFEANPGQGR